MSMSEELLQDYADNTLASRSSCPHRSRRSLKPGRVPPDVEELDGAAVAREEYHDLKEHMVGILFSRESLSDLQKQVVEHIVDGISVEACRLRERSDDGGPDDYCFELMSMFLALSGSRVGQECLAKKGPFLLDMMCLLHLGSPRVQRQVRS
jgi:hypothetical protein